MAGDGCRCRLGAVDSHGQGHPHRAIADGAQPLPFERNPLVYISARNFVSALRALQARPQGKRIGSASLTALSNHVRKNVLSDFESLGLIRRDGVPDEGLEQLAKCVDGPRWPWAIETFVRDRWDLDERGIPDAIAIAASHGGDPRSIERTMKFLAHLESCGSFDERAAAKRTRRADASDQSTIGRVNAAVGAIDARPLIQIGDGMVLLDAAALASMSDEETQRLAGLLKVFARLACRGTDGLGPPTSAIANSDASPA